VLAISSDHRLNIPAEDGSQLLAGSEEEYHKLFTMRKYFLNTDFFRV